MTVSKRFSLSRRQISFAVYTLTMFAAAVCVIAFLILILGNSPAPNKVWGFFGLIFLSSTILGIYLYYGNIQILQKPKKLVGLASIMFFSYTAFLLMDKYVSPYAVPYAFCALLTGLVISRKSGFFATLIVILLIFFSNSFFGSNDGQLQYISITAGISTSIVGAFAYSRQNVRLKYILVALYLTVITVIANLLLDIVFGYEDFAATWYMTIGYSALGSVVSVAAFLFAAPVMDTVFKFTTDFRLAELISTNQPLLKRLFKEAPGTFNHSLTLANYADACASAIGENTYLARAAAYYHDVGKLKNPSYFSENQMDGVNPHDELTPELSVSIIRKHISNGLALAKEYHLPEEVSKAIAEHHGTLPLRFFFDKAQKYSEKDLADTEYRYDGPKPTNKISALIMVADACEATLRATNPSNRSDAEKVVGGIISERFKYEQFNDCDITMKDLEIIRQTIVTVYAGISHARIEYPAAKTPKESNEI